MGRSTSQTPASSIVRVRPGLPRDSLTHTVYFDDGTNPTMEMCREFIDLADRTIREGGVVAVHCKAGLGRTGTLIGAYMIYKWGFTAAEAIGLMRIMRPGVRGLFKAD